MKCPALARGTGMLPANFKSPMVCDCSKLNACDSQRRNSGILERRQVPLERITTHEFTRSLTRSELRKDQAPKAFPALLDSRSAISRSRRGRELAARWESLKNPIRAGQAFRLGPEDSIECDRTPGDIGDKLEYCRPFLPNTC